MPRLSLWKEGTHSADYKFQDRRIKELFTAGGVGINVHKYLGPLPQGDTGDFTQNTGLNPNELTIQDVLFLENRDRKYDKDIYNMRGHYTVQDTDFNLSQFGLFITNDTIFMTFHINDMIERMGRKIMAGDVFELPHIRDFNPLDPNDEIPIALRKYYVVQETTRAAEGFAATWWPHLWRVKLTPMVNGQEYKDLFNNLEDENGNKIFDNISTYDKEVAINNAILDQAEQDVAKSGYDTDPLWTLPTDPNGDPAIPYTASSDSIRIKGDSTVYSADTAPVTPKRGYLGYLVGDGLAPNGYKVTSATQFPSNAVEGDYVLRLDFYPNRLFRFDGIRWAVVEQNNRADLTGATNETLLGTFVNNTKVTKTQRGEFIDQRVPLSQVLRIKPDTP